MSGNITRWTFKAEMFLDVSAATATFSFRIETVIFTLTEGRDPYLMLQVSESSMTWLSDVSINYLQIFIVIAMNWRAELEIFHNAVSDEGFSTLYQMVLRSVLYTKQHTVASTCLIKILQALVMLSTEPHLEETLLVNAGTDEKEKPGGEHRPEELL